jgi:hypothetical protein
VWRFVHHPYPSPILADQVQNVLANLLSAQQTPLALAGAGAVGGDQLQQMFASLLGVPMPATGFPASMPSATAPAMNCTPADAFNITGVPSPMSSMPADMTALTALILPWTAFLGMPDWMKLAVIGTILEYLRRTILGWWDSIKESFFLTLVLDCNDMSYGTLLPHPDSNGPSVLIHHP